MPALTDKQLRVLHQFTPMIYGKEKSCITNTRDGFCIIEKEKNSFINHFKPSLNTKEDNAELLLFTQ